MSNYKQQKVLAQPLSGSLAAYSERDAKWAIKRRQVQDVGVLYDMKQEYRRLAERMSDCSGRLTFERLAHKIEGTIRYKLAGARFCKVRNCPMCQWRRSVRNLSRFHAALPAIREAFPKHRFLFLTLTVPNPKYEDLRKTVVDMNKGFQRLIQRKEWPAVGFVKSVEVTNEENAKTGKKRPGYAHPHFHILMMVPPSYFHHNYLSQSRWLELWREAMRDESITQLNVKAVNEKDDLGKAVQETLKYSLKVEDALQDPEFLFCMTRELHKMRFLSLGGIFKDMLKDMKEVMTDDEMIDREETADDGEEARIGQINFDFDFKRRDYFHD